MRIWNRFTGIPLTDPYTAEYEWLEDQLLDLKDELSGNQPKRTLTEISKESK